MRKTDAAPDAADTVRCRIRHVSRLNMNGTQQTAAANDFSDLDPQGIFGSILGRAAGA